MQYKIQHKINLPFTFFVETIFYDQSDNHDVLNINVSIHIDNGKHDIFEYIGILLDNFDDYNYVNDYLSLHKNYDNSMIDFNKTMLLCIEYFDELRDYIWNTLEKWKTQISDDSKILINFSANNDDDDDKDFEIKLKYICLSFLIYGHKTKWMHDNKLSIDTNDALINKFTFVRFANDIHVDTLLFIETYIINNMLLCNINDNWDLNFFNDLFDTFVKFMTIYYKLNPASVIHPISIIIDSVADSLNDLHMQDSNKYNINIYNIKDKMIMLTCKNVLNVFNYFHNSYYDNKNPINFYFDIILCNDDEMTHTIKKMRDILIINTRLHEFMRKYYHCQLYVDEIILKINVHPLMNMIDNYIDNSTISLLFSCYDLTLDIKQSYIYVELIKILYNCDTIADINKFFKFMVTDVIDMDNDVDIYGEDKINIIDLTTSKVSNDYCTHMNKQKTKNDFMNNFNEIKNNMKKIDDISIIKKSFTYNNRKKKTYK
jgi:hypothetical protein